MDLEFINKKKEELLDLLENNHEKLNNSDLNILNTLKNDVKKFKIGSKVIINGRMFIICKPYTNTTVVLIDLIEGILYTDRRIDNDSNYIKYHQLVFLAGTDEFTIPLVSFDGVINNFSRQ